MTRCAVLGDPVAHSLSPTLHAAAYDELGLDWTYEAHRVPAGGLDRFLAGLSDPADRAGTSDGGWRGLSLTMPLKREALAWAATGAGEPGGVVEVTERARLAGGANTVVLDDGAVRLLDNTDLPGAVAAVRERSDAPGASVCVLGAGATAASIGLALCELGATSIRLLARDPGRAEESRGQIAAHASQPAVSVGSLAPDGVDPADVLVSTIPAAAQTDAATRLAASAGLVFEALYDPWPTPVATAASAAGVPLVGGLDLLVHQAVLQVELFSGRTPSVAVLRAAGERELDRRRTEAC